MNHNPFYAAINAKLAEIVEASKTIPIWNEGWKKLHPTAPGEERLAIYQAIRDAGSLPEAAGLYLVAWQINAMTSEIAEGALRPHRAANPGYVFGAAI